MSPSYFKPATIRDLVDFCVPIAAQAEPLPIYYYDIPGMTGVRLKMSEFLYQARFRIPNLRGLKYSNEDLLELQECVRQDQGAFDVLLGSDECLLAGLCLGIRGAVGSTYNFAAPVYQRLMKAYGKHDFPAARAEQAKSIELVKALNEFGFLAASKSVMAMLGVDCGPVRPPLRNLTTDQRLALWERVSAPGCVPPASEKTGLIGRINRPAERSRPCGTRSDGSRPGARNTRRTTSARHAARLPISERPGRCRLAAASRTESQARR